MKILITGSTGLLGGNLARYLHQQGYDIKALVRNRASVALNDIPAERCKGDLLDRESLRKAVQGVDWVIHAGACVHIGKKFRQTLFDVNVEGTRNLCQIMLEEGIKNLLHVSTVDTLEIQSFQEPADESCTTSSDEILSNYGKSKKKAELIVEEYIQKGLHIPIILPCFMIGPWDTKPSSGRMILEVSRGNARFPPSGGNNFIHVLDVCVGIEKALHKGISGRKYIMGNTNMTYFEAWNVMAECTNAPKPIFQAPDWFVYLIGYLMDFVYHFSKQEGPLNSVATFLGIQPHYFDSSRAIEELDLPQTPIRQAIQDAWDWFQANGYG